MSMRLKANSLALVAVVVCVVAFWQETTDRDVAVAQGRKAVVVTRIYTGPDGLAHAEDIELTLSARGISEMFKATGAEFSVRPPTPGATPDTTTASSPSAPEWHTGPERSEEHTSELQSLRQLVCRLLLDKKKPTQI